jgi:hypothetical protein
MSRIVIVILIYHRHKPIYRSYLTRRFITVIKNSSWLDPVFSQLNPIHALTVQTAAVCRNSGAAAGGISRNCLSGRLSHVPDNELGESTFYTVRGFCDSDSTVTCRLRCSSQQLVAFHSLTSNTVQVGRQILAGGSLSRSSHTQVGEPKIGEHARWQLFCLSNNSDVHVIGSLLLVHCVLLLRAVCLFFSPSLSLSLVSLCRRDKFVA